MQGSILQDIPAVQGTKTPMLAIARSSCHHASCLSSLSSRGPHNTVIAIDIPRTNPRTTHKLCVDDKPASFL